MNFSEFQGVINKISGVISSKVTVENDVLSEIHVLANNLRSPKQLVRDIESSILASYDYRIDRKIISIAQIQSEESEGGGKRIKYIGISVNSYDNVIECTVKLMHEEEEFINTQIGIKTSSNRKKIIADTTVKTVEQIIGKELIFEVQDVMIESKNELNFVTVLVNLICGASEEALIGSVIIRNDTNEAIAKATLDAVNRRVDIIRD